MNRSDAFPVLRRNPDTAAEIERILGLPPGRWGDLKVELTNEGPAQATVTFLVTPDELLQLATLACRDPLQSLWDPF